MTAFIDERESSVTWKSEAKDKTEQTSAEEQLLQFDKAIVQGADKKPFWTDLTTHELEEIEKAKSDLAQSQD